MKEYIKITDNIWIAYDTEKMTAVMVDKEWLDKRLTQLTSELKDIPTKEVLDEARMTLEMAGVMVNPGDYGHYGMLETEKIEIEAHLEGMK